MERKNGLDVRCNSHCHRQHGWAVTIKVRTHRDCRAMHGTCALKISPQDRADRARSPGCTRLVAKTTCKFHPARQHATAEPGTVDMAPAASSPAQPKSIAAWRRPNSWILLGEIGGCLGPRRLPRFQSSSGVPTGKPQSNSPQLSPRPVARRDPCRWQRTSGRSPTGITAPIGRVHQYRRGCDPNHAEASVPVAVMMIPAPMPMKPEFPDAHPLGLTRYPR